PDFAQRLRACPGMGLVPIVYLTRDGELPEGAPERCAARRRDESDVVIAQTFNQLRGLVHLGRTFTRYLTVLDVDLHHAGRGYRCHSIDLSRGGVLLQCGIIPAVGSSVRVVLHLPGWELEIPGVVV